MAYPDGDGSMILSTDQGAYDTQHETMGCWDLPGGKSEGPQLPGGARLPSARTRGRDGPAPRRPESRTDQRPVSKLTRDSIRSTQTTPLEWSSPIGCDENGIIGVAAEVNADTGPTLSGGGRRSGLHPRRRSLQLPEFLRRDGWAYNQQPPPGPFRGFGVTQPVSASNLLNQWRTSWALPPGNPLPQRIRRTGAAQRPDRRHSNGMVETLEAGKPYVEKNQYVGLAAP